MKIEKVIWYDLVCPNCGSKIRLSADEYDKYRKETEKYGGSTILCTEYDENDKSYELVYTNFDCPVCGHYIPVTVTDVDECCSQDRIGFKCSKNVTPFYMSAPDISIYDYINKHFGDEE